MSNASTPNASALHWSDSRLEVHRVVVGPYENNVFVIRCKETGEGILIDAANEHELLLEMCQRLGVKRVLETHGHGDHIQAVPAMREAGYEVAVTALDAPRLKAVGYEDRKSTRLNSSHSQQSRMPSSA